MVDEILCTKRAHLGVCVCTKRKSKVFIFGRYLPMSNHSLPRTIFVKDVRPYLMCMCLEVWCVEAERASLGPEGVSRYGAALRMMPADVLKHVPLVKITDLVGDLGWDDETFETLWTPEYDAVMSIAHERGNSRWSWEQLCDEDWVKVKALTGRFRCHEIKTWSPTCLQALTRLRDEVTPGYVVLDDDSKRCLTVWLVSSDEEAENCNNTYRLTLLVPNEYEYQSKLKRMIATQLNLMIEHTSCDVATMTDSRMLLHIDTHVLPEDWQETIFENVKRVTGRKRSRA